MKFNEARKILKDLNDSKKEIEGMVGAASIIAQNHFTMSFRNQGFTDEAIAKWKARKKADAGRAILVKTGALRRSIRVRPQGMFRAVIYSNLPYAQIQNDGGVINKRSRTSILSFSSAGRFARQRTVRQRNSTSFQQKATIGAYGINIPARPFIGDSGALNRKIISKFQSRIDKIFR